MPTPVASRFSASARLPEPVADVDYDDDYGDETEPFVDSVLSRSESFTPVPPPPVPAEAEAEAPRRRVPRNSLLIGVIGLVLAVGLIAAMMLSTRSPQPQKAAAPVASAVQIAKADDFDPKADGGSGALTCAASFNATISLIQEMTRFWRRRRRGPKSFGTSAWTC